MPLSTLKIQSDPFPRLLSERQKLEIARAVQMRIVSVEQLTQLFKTVGSVQKKSKSWESTSIYLQDKTQKRNKSMKSSRKKLSQIGLEYNTKLGLLMMYYQKQSLTSSRQKEISLLKIYHYIRNSTYLVFLKLKVMIPKILILLGEDLKVSMCLNQKSMSGSEGNQTLKLLTKLCNCLTKKVAKINTIQDKALK